MAETQQTALPEQEQLELELQLLRSVAGVTLANAYPAKRVDPCRNNNFVKVVVERAADPIKVHLSGHCPSRLLAAREARRQLAELLGEAAIEKAIEVVLSQQHRTHSVSTRGLHGGGKGRGWARDPRALRQGVPQAQQ